MNKAMNRISVPAFLALTCICLIVASNLAHAKWFSEEAGLDSGELVRVIDEHGTVIVVPTDNVPPSCSVHHDAIVVADKERPFLSGKSVMECFIYGVRSGH